MKWIGGVILLIITIILLITSMFMFPWFETKSKYHRNTINEKNPEYWDEKLGGLERDWDESIYYLQEYELKSSTNIDWQRTNQSTGATGSDKLEYNSPVKSGGWDGSYREMVETDYPVPGFLPGGNEQLNVYNYTYYMILLAFIMAIIAIIFIVISGLGKISPTAPKVITAITIIFVILSCLYFALALPYAIETDDEELQKLRDPLHETDHETPPEAGGAVMGEANERSDDGTPLSKIEWSPGLGWWMVVGAIITSMISMLFMPIPEQPVETTPPHLRRKYHEFDETGRGYDIGGYDQEYIPPQRRQSTAEYYEDDYYEPAPRGRERPGYDSHDMYSDDYARSRPPPQRRRGPPPSHDYGRPAPRPPQRKRRPPPGH